MKRRYLTVAVGLFAVAGIALGVLAMLPARSGVTKANFDRIEIGMTADDAERIFGCPATPELGWCVWSGRRFDEPSGGQGWIAKDRSAVAMISYQEGRIVEKAWSSLDESILKEIRRWLHLD